MKLPSIASFSTKSQRRITSSRGKALGFAIPGRGGDEAGDQSEGWKIELLVALHYGERQRD